MHTGDRVPRIRIGAKMAEAIVEMSSKGFGWSACSTPRAGRRDHHQRRSQAAPESNLLMDTPVEEVMTRSPRTIAPEALAAEALKIISRKIQALLVVEAGEVVGIVNFHDLLRIGAA